MRSAALAPLLLAPLALAAPDALAAFEPAVAQLEQLPTSTNDTTPVDAIAELLKRDVCAKSYYQCSNAPSVCCPRTAICSADRNNVVGCCPQGVACTGTVATPTASGTTAPFVTATTTGSSGPFIQASNTASAAASTVSNAFYPFPYIATTYTNAAACSSAYTRCQSDAASCTNALMGGAQGVTVVAPNGGGATITAVPSLGAASASENKEKTPMYNPFSRAPRGGAAWFNAGPVSSFPAIDAENNGPLAQQRKCNEVFAPGCKVFHVPVEDAAQASVVAIDEWKDEGVGSAKEQVMVFRNVHTPPSHSATGRPSTSKTSA
ncbi:hypothetical protein E8E13_000666 [Curvularia kusanoi]|uniref:Uncharacterized protein n=1 Tax=Curvularia kusanoi TaxID=90978 RepID=A0A9P4T6S5_CURKU|nr:hypothetical protein E8E13_000666 [Curvularia kusanoi]